MLKRLQLVFKINFFIKNEKRARFYTYLLFLVTSYMDIHTYNDKYLQISSYNMIIIKY